MKKIYISGKINGLTKEQITKSFELGAGMVKALRRNEELDIFNPATLDEKMPGQTYETYMALSLQEMLACDEVYFLPGWETSRGANLEMQVANACGIKINFI